MKRKIFITILIVIMALTLTSAMFACKKTPPDTKSDPKPDPQPVGPEFSDVFDAILTSADRTLGAVANVDKEAYYAATLYFEVKSGDEDAVKYEFTVKGNFDAEDLDNNAGYIEIVDYSATAKPVAQIFVNDNTVYVGEALTQASGLNWFKLEQAAGQDFIEDYFSKLPGLINEYLSDLKDGDFLASKVGTIGAVIGAVGSTLFTCTAPSTFDAEEENIDGDYVLEINMDQISELLNDPSVGGIISGVKLPENILGPINLVLPILLGYKINTDTAGAITGLTQEGITPAISISASIANKNITAIGISYSKATDPDADENTAIDVKFGIKNLEASNKVASAASKYTPAGMPDEDDIKQGAVKLTLDLGIGYKDGFDEVQIEAYLVPDLEFGFLDDEFGLLNIDGLVGYAYASFGGEQLDGELAVKYSATEGFVMDLAGLYDALGMDKPANTIYYNKDLVLNDFVLGSDSEQPDNATANPIDTIVDSFTGENVKIFDAIFDNIGGALDLLGDFFALFTEDVIAADDEDASVAIDLLALMDKLAGFDPLKTSTNLKINGKAFTDYCDSDDTIRLIEEALGWEEDELAAFIMEFTGISVTPTGNQTLTEALTEYLQEEGLTLVAQGYLGETATDDGLGFTLALKADDTAIATIGLKADIISVDDALEAVDDANLALFDFDFEEVGDAQDLSDSAVWDALIEEFKSMLDAYKAI